MRMLPDAEWRSPVRASISSVWPFPSTPAMPTISPARTSNETPRTASRPRSSRTTTSSIWSSGSPGWAGFFSTPQQHLAPDHRACEPSLGRAFARNRLDELPAPEHADPIRDLQHLVQLVADEDDRFSLGLELVDDLEQLLRLLRRPAPRSARRG
jgi:hypothetical protein